MEQARYWMWTKRKHDLSSHVSSSTTPCFDDSWEEQAFAEDAAGVLGGCVWPPRSYTCSFCRREFRSAQALGGHMNVHRRDRARLKQSPTPQTENLPQNNPNPYKPLENRDKPQMCNLLYNPSSNINHKIHVSPSSPKTSSEKNTLVAPCIFPVLEERSKNALPSVPPWSNVSDMKNKEKKSEMEKSNPREFQQFVKADLSSMSLNLVIRRNSSDDHAEEFSSFKRQRIDDEKPLTFFPIHKNSIDRCKPKSEIMPELMNPAGLRDDVDLELRLGDPPKVK